MATIKGSCDNSRYILTCDYSYTQNVSANTSTITAKVYLDGNGYTTSSSYWNCVINGTTVTSNKSADIGSKTLLGSRTWTVNHNSDGTCKTTISFSYSNGLSSSGTYTTKTGSGSATVTLPTIARASSFTLNRTSATIGSDAITVNISRASSSFTHTVIYKFGSISADQATKTSATSVTFTPVLSDCSQIPNGTSGTATVIVDTYNGNTKIGSASKTITLNVPSSVVPTIGSVSLVGNNLLGSVYVAGKSTVTAKINSAAGVYSSTIKSYNISGAGISSTASSATSGALSAGTHTITGKVTDSRGRTASKSASITVHSYYSPSVSIKAYRCDSSGNKSDSGTYAKVDITPDIVNVGNANINVKQYRVEAKKASESSWTVKQAWTNLSSYNSATTYNLGSGWDNTTTYNIRVSVKDSYNTVSAITAIGTISCIMNIEQKGIGIGKPYEQGGLDVAGDIHGVGSVKLTSSVDGKIANLNPGSLELRSFGEGDTESSGFVVDVFENQFRVRIGGGGTASNQGLSVQGPGDAIYANIQKTKMTVANEMEAPIFRIPGPYGSNYITKGTGDGNDYTTYNVKFRTHNGLAFTDNNENATVIVQGRQGRIMGKNAYYVNSSRILKSDIRVVVSEQEPVVAHLKQNETVDTNITTELICDFLDHIGVRTYVTDFYQKGATQDDVNPNEGHSLNLGYIADEIANHQVFDYIGEKTDDGLYAINSNALTTALIVAYQSEKKARLKLEARLTEIETYLKEVI